LIGQQQPREHAAVATCRRLLNNVQARFMLASGLAYRENLMQTTTRAMLIGLLLMMLSVSFADADAQGLDELSWLSGCWAIENSEPGSTESWLAPAGGTMLGVSRTVKGGKTVAYEFMQIHALDNGTLAFTAKPSNQAEATFTLLRSGKHEITFENKAHDFPQRVSYRLVAAGTLMARIEGTRNGKERAIDYPMKKIACAGGTE
jgi:hypothetical protein